MSSAVRRPRGRPASPRPLGTSGRGSGPPEWAPRRSPGARGRYRAQAVLAAGPDPSPCDAPHLRGPGLGRRARGLGLAGTTAEPPGAPRGCPRPWVTIKSRPQGRAAAASNQPGASSAVRHAGPPLQRAPPRDWLSGRPRVVRQLIGPRACPASSGVGGAARARWRGGAPEAESGGGAGPRQEEEPAGLCAFCRWASGPLTLGSRPGLTRPRGAVRAASSHSLLTNRIEEAWMNPLAAWCTVVGSPPFSQRARAPNLSCLVPQKLPL